MSGLLGLEATKWLVLVIFVATFALMMGRILQLMELGINKGVGLWNISKLIVAEVEASPIDAPLDVPAVRRLQWLPKVKLELHCRSQTGAILFDGDPKVWWLQKRPVNFWKAFSIGHDISTPLVVSAVDVGDLLSPRQASPRGRSASSTTC